MLTQGSITDAKNESIPRNGSYLVVTMRFYPRFLKREKRDEFACELAPVKELLHDFNSAQKRLGDHNPAFAEVDYENRFHLSKDGFESLQRLADLSNDKDVYLLCVCKLGDRCHREMLMLLAQHLFQCDIGKVFHKYPTFEGRLEEFKKALK